jgi:hypothetical protein
MRKKSDAKAGIEYAYTMVHGAPAPKLPEYVIPALAGAHK